MMFGGAGILTGFRSYFKAAMEWEQAMLEARVLMELSESQQRVLIEKAVEAARGPLFKTPTVYVKHVVGYWSMGDLEVERLLGP